MKIFTAVDVGRMGEPDPEYGQSYWGVVEEQEAPVRFNLKQVLDIEPGRKFVAGEFENRLSKGSGKPYTQLKKVKLSEPETTPIVETEQSLEEIVNQEDGEGYAQAVATRDEIVARQTSPAFIEMSTDTPSYEAGTNARWAIGMAYRAYQQVMGTPEDGKGEFPFDLVLLHAQQLVAMFEILKNPSDKEE